MLNYNKYIIVEVIPTTRKKETGNIAQISALKIDNNEIKERFDYRLDKKKINNNYILDMINYDNDKFKYKSSTKEIIKYFQNFIKDYPLLIIDNDYTISYLSDLENKKISFFGLFNIPLDENSFDILIKKYNLVPSNYLVDLMYEALIVSDINENK